MASLNPISGTLGYQRAAHLLRRATFGPTIEGINTYASMTVDQAVLQLINADPEAELPKDPLTGTLYIAPYSVHEDTLLSTISHYTISWWLEQVRTSGVNLNMRMAYFYYTHFPIILDRIDGYPQMLIDYMKLLKRHSLTNYKDFTRAICIDNAMLIHLDGNLNVKSAPQENFAREFLELFTVGKGAEVGEGDYTNFTEHDVKMATKCLTGWGVDTTFQTLDPTTNIARGKVKSGNSTHSSHHDVSDKTFSAAFNNATISTNGVSGSNALIAGVEDELTAFINMVFESINTAKTICRRLYRHFVYFDITEEIENDIITPLAEHLMENNYEISLTLMKLFQSEHFYDMDTTVTEKHNIGAIIKSPLDLLMGTLRLFNLSIPDYDTQVELHYSCYNKLYDYMSLQGLDLFQPYDVAGHDPYFQYPDYQRYWISANYLANRYKFAEYLIEGIEVDGVEVLKLDVVQFVREKCSNPSNATTLVQELCQWMLPIELNAERFNYFRDNVLLDSLSATNWANEWNNYISSSDDTNVRIQLELLVKSIMQSPEYQLY